MCVLKNLFLWEKPTLYWGGKKTPVVNRSCSIVPTYSCGGINICEILQYKLHYKTLQEYERDSHDVLKSNELKWPNS